MVAVPLKYLSPSRICKTSALSSICIKYTQILMVTHRQNGRRTQKIIAIHQNVAFFKKCCTTTKSSSYSASEFIISSSTAPLFPCESDCTFG